MFFVVYPTPQHPALLLWLPQQNRLVTVSTINKPSKCVILNRLIECSKLAVEMKLDCFVQKTIFTHKTFSEWFNLKTKITHLFFCQHLYGKDFHSWFAVSFSIYVEWIYFTVDYVKVLKYEPIFFRIYPVWGSKDIYKSEDISGTVRNCAK